MWKNRSRSKWRSRVCVAALTITPAVLAIVGSQGTANADGSLPCDIYAAAGTPCVAAHSTVRALFSGYTGSLYQVTRASDGTTDDIGVLSTGGYADAAEQDSFCNETTCRITKIYDQTSNHNDLLVEGPGDQGGQDVGAVADALPVTVGGHAVYGVYVTPGVGYRTNGAATGTATNGEAEGMYMVTSGHTANSGCCFDYGNVEATESDTGAGHMDAINFSTFAPGGAGSGPWVQADLENGVYSEGDGNTNTSNLGNSQRFVTAMLKNDGQTTFAVKGGDAQSGSLSTWYSGALPSGYSPMHQEGAIVLGTGGDNSRQGTGSFFEGVLTSGYPSDSADDSVQANIVSAGYTAPPSGTLQIGSEMSLRATTPCCTTNYIRHANGVGEISPISGSSSYGDRSDATFVVRRGLASSCISFEARGFPNNYLRHYNGQIYLNANDGSSQFAQDATFCPVAGLNGQGNSFQSYNFPTNYIRHSDGYLYINPSDGTSGFNDDASWVVSAPWV